MATKTGEKTVAASASRVIDLGTGNSTSLGAKGQIKVMPLADNTDSVTYFGGSNVTVANGWPVAKGTSFTFEATSASELYCIGVTTSDKVRWIVMGTTT